MDGNGAQSVISEMKKYNKIKALPDQVVFRVRRVWIAAIPDDI